MVRHTLKILQQMLQDFKSVSDHFGTLCIKGLRNFRPNFQHYIKKIEAQAKKKKSFFIKKT